MSTNFPGPKIKYRQLPSFNPPTFYGGVHSVAEWIASPLKLAKKI